MPGDPDGHSFDAVHVIMLRDFHQFPLLVKSGQAKGKCQGFDSNGFIL